MEGGREGRVSSFMGDLTLLLAASRVLSRSPSREGGKKGGAIFRF